MDSDSMTRILFIAVLIVMSAYFSASETAFSVMNKIRIKGMASDGNKKAKLVMKLADNYDGVMTTLLIGNSIVNICAAVMAVIMFDELYGSSGAWLSAAVMTVVILLFGEIAPKSAAKNSPEAFMLFSAPILRIVKIILSPLTFVFSLWQKLVRRIFKPSEDRGVTEEELLTMVEEAQNGGGIDSHESELIRNAIEFNDIEVVDIHTNRVDIVAVDIEDTQEEIEKVFRENGYSRLPVYRDSIDNIVGILNQKDFNNAVNDGLTVEQVMIEPVFVIPSMKISQLLTLLQKEKSHMAVIIDEYGGTVGIVTLEDILEELVGEIWDEHDEVIESIEKIGDNKYKVLCNSSLDNLFEMFGLENDFDITTVGGWVVDKFERIPDEGDSFKYENLRVVVTKRDSRHVNEITVEVLEPEPAKEEDG